jgi:glycosyltransferase involved in cell wall biosynthesis
VSRAPDAVGIAPLRIGADALNLLHDRRGIGRYVRALLSRWVQREDVDVVLLVPHVFPWLVSGALARELGAQRVEVDRRSHSARHRLQVAWHPWNGIFFKSGTRDVATIHDVWPFVDAPAENPELAQSRQRPFFEAAAKSERIVTDSQFSKGEIVRQLGVDPDRIDVVYLGVERSLSDTQLTPARLSNADQYVLFVGETEGRKDLATLLVAMAHLPPSLRDRTPLVVAGKIASSASITAGVRVEFVGEVTEEELASLYAGSAAFAFPSRYEGFGLPILEAMAYGTPVVASDAASLPEAGGDAALYFPAGDAAGCAALLERVLTEPELAASLRARGRARAAEMTWDRCADATLEILRGVARGS